MTRKRVYTKLDYNSFDYSDERLKDSRVASGLNLSEALADIMEERHTVTIDGKRNRLTALEIYVRRIQKDAERGDKLAMKHILSQSENIVEVHRTRRRVEQELLRYRKLWFFDLPEAEQKRLCNKGKGYPESEENRRDYEFLKNLSKRF